VYIKNSKFSKLLLKEELPTEGKIIVDGVDLTELPKRKTPFYRRKLGIVFQDFRLFPDKTVYENIAFALRVTGEPSINIKRKVLASLKVVNLSEKYKCYPDQLSGGEQQRIALARALVNNPGIIIADEPTGNIDPKMSMEIMSMLVKINKRGKTVIVVTHEKELVDFFKQRVITIYGGRVVDDRVGGMYSEEL